MFVRANHLSMETERAVLGLDRAARDERQPVTVDLAGAFELDVLQEDGIRT
jgi:hypothetical protein